MLKRQKPVVRYARKGSNYRLLSKEFIKAARVQRGWEKEEWEIAGTERYSEEQGCVCIPNGIRSGQSFNIKLWNVVLRLTLAPPAVCSITRVSVNVWGYSWLLTDLLGVPAGNQKPASNPTGCQSPQFGNYGRFKQLCRFLWFHLSAFGLDALQPGFAPRRRCLYPSDWHRVVRGQKPWFCTQWIYW